MLEIDPSRMYKIYLKKVFEATTLPELRTLAEEIRTNPKLSEGERHHLLTVIGKREKEIAEPWDAFVVDVEAKAEVLPATPALKEAFTNFMLYYMPMRSKSLRYLREDTLRDITKFIEWYSKILGRDVDITDFDASRLSIDIVSRYLMERAMDFFRRTGKRMSPETQRKIWSRLYTFGYYLNKSYRQFVREFLGKKDVPIEKPIEPKSVKTERSLGRLLGLDQLRKIREALNIYVKGIATWKAILYKHYFRLLISTGIRPEHAGCLRFVDLTDVNWVTDALDREFAEIKMFEAVRREKESRGESIHLKYPPEFIYISKGFYEDLVEFWNQMNWPEDAKIFKGDTDSYYKQIAKLSAYTGIPKLTRYSFRHTWATVVYQATNHDVHLVEKLGGWSPGSARSSIPFEHYVKIMSEREALQIVEEFDVYIPAKKRDIVQALRQAFKLAKPEEVPRMVEEHEKFKKEVLDIIKRLMSRIGELEERLRRYEEERGRS